jgi:hypothetical protein
MTSMKDHTTVYVWGEGYQVDASQEYSNFTPKKIKEFYGEDKPDIIDCAFGWYHEAYIDKLGRLFVCHKAKMSSIKIAEVEDGVRQTLVQVVLPIGAGKVRQVAFTEERMFAKQKPEFTGELFLDTPFLVKEIPPLKMIACG